MSDGRPSRQETAKSTAAAAKENVARPAMESGKITAAEREKKKWEKQVHNHVSSRLAACV